MLSKRFIAELRQELKTAKSERDRLDRVIEHAEGLLSLVEEAPQGEIFEAGAESEMDATGEAPQSETEPEPPPEEEAPRVEIEDPNYPTTGTVAQRILYAIRTEGRFLHRSQIQAFMEAREPKVSKNTLSYTVTIMFQRGDMMRVQFNDAQHMIGYGLPYMVYPNGNGLTYADPSYRPTGKPFEHADPATREFHYHADIREAVMASPSAN